MPRTGKSRQGLSRERVMPMRGVLLAVVFMAAHGMGAWAVPNLSLSQPLVRGPGITACAFAADGKSIFFSQAIGRKREIREVFLQALDGTGSGPIAAAEATVVTAGLCPVPLNDRLLFVRRGRQGGGLWVRDLATGQETQLRRDPFFGLPPTASADGKLIMISRRAGRTQRIGAVDPDTGKFTAIPGNDMSFPALSVAGDRLLFVRARHVWLRDLGTQQEQQLTTGDMQCSWPAWAPNGTLIGLCVQLASGPSKVGVLELETGTATWTKEDLVEPVSPSFSPDSRTVIYATKEPGGQSVIWRAQVTS